jgi:hypothetical protein
VQAFEITSLPEVAGRKILLVGAAPLVMSRWYDPDQLWLPFMQGAIFLAPPAPRHPTRCPRGTLKSKVERKKFAHCPSECRQPYVYEHGVEQFVLPFVEFKCVSHSQFKELSRTKFPTWQRHSGTGNILSVNIVDRPYDPREWCRENFDGRFHCNTRHIVCELEIDALRAKLVFS